MTFIGFALRIVHSRRFSAFAVLLATVGLGCIVVPSAGARVPWGNLYQSKFGSPGSGNGNFNAQTGPSAIAINPVDGTVYVTDPGDYRVERFAGDGTYVGKWGTQGSGPGQFSDPEGIAVDPTNGDVYVTDHSNNRVQKFGPDGTFILQFGTTGSGNGQFSAPREAAVDPPTGNLYVVDGGNHRIEKFDQSGNYLSQFGTQGSGNGQFATPYGVAVDPATGTVYVTDPGNTRVETFTSAGTFVAKFGTPGIAPGQLSFAQGIAVNPSDRSVYVGDGNNDVVNHFSAAGAYLGRFGGFGSENGQLVHPLGVAVRPLDGGVVVVDSINDRVQQFSAAGGLQSQVGAPGVGNGQFNTPFGLGFDDNSGGFYVADYSNNRVQKLDAAGNFVSQFGSPGSGNGQFSHPGWVAVDPNTSDVFVVDQGNHRVEQFDPAGHFMIAFGSSYLLQPLGIAIDPYNDTVYVSDYSGNKIYKFLAFNPAVAPTSFGMTGTAHGQFTSPAGLAVDPTDLSLYVADLSNNRVQKFDVGGGFLLQIGSGTASAAPGELKLPEAVAVDPYDDAVYVSDTSNNRVERFDQHGQFQAEFGSSGSGAAQFNGPEGIGVSASTGTTYVVDQVNNRVEWFGTPAAPACASQNVATPEGAATTITLSCTGPAGVTPVYGIASNPGHGTLSGFSPYTGNVTYTPAPGYSGSDAFSFRGGADGGSSANQTVSITVNPPPGCLDVHADTSAGVATTVQLACTDSSGAPVTFVLDSRPAHGTLGLIAQSTGRVAYTPAAGYAGSDSFTYHAVSTNGAGAAKTVTITVKPQPSCVDVSVVTRAGAKIAVQLSCVDPTGAAVSYVLDSQPAHGTLGQIDQSSGRVIYTPKSGYTGPDSFTYHATSPNGTASSRTAKVTVNALGQITSSLTWSFPPHQKSVSVASLVAHLLPLGTSVQIVCSGRGCPFKKHTIVAAAPKCKRGKSCRPPAKVDVALTAQFRHHQLAFGTQLTVRFLKPGWIGRVYVFTISSSNTPQISCLAPGSTVPGKGC
jgi:DNA-binding beta-propeller fold protein YncE